jgi:hypothetical protein
MSSDDALETVVEAVRGAAAGPIHPNASRLESELVRAVQEHVAFPTKREYGATEVLDWVRQPGGVDLAVLDEYGQGWLLMEMKVDDLDQSLWDVFKLASLLRHEHVERAFLVYEAATPVFEGATACARLFRGAETRASVIELISLWPKAWSDLLDGGYGNHPLGAVADLKLVVRQAVPLVHYPGHEIRLVEVIAAGEALEPFGEDGWPARLPTSIRPLRKEVHRTPRPPSIGQDHAPMPFPKRITQPWLESSVPDMDDAEFDELLEVLRRKGWSSMELDERVYPLHREAAPEPVDPDRADPGAHRL